MSDETESAERGADRDRADETDLIDGAFDQTNGVAAGLDGDSDGTAESDLLDRRERNAEDPAFEDAEVRSDDDGVHDLRDPNP